MANLPILAQIQEFESRARVLERKIEELKQDSKLAPLEALQQELELKLAEMVAKQQIIEKESRAKEFDLQDSEARIKQTEATLYAGNTSNIRELNQLQQKIDDYTKGKSKVETELYELLEQTEGLAKEDAVLKQQQQKIVAEISSLRQAAKEQAAELRIELEMIKLQLPELLDQLPAEWVERYRKLAKQRNGIGLAKVKGTSCDGCHVTLPEGLLQKVKRGEDQLLYCDNCGRILYCG